MINKNIFDVQRGTIVCPKNIQGHLQKSMRDNQIIAQSLDEIAELVIMHRIGIPARRIKIPEIHWPLELWSESRNVQRPMNLDKIDVLLKITEKMVDIAKEINKILENTVNKNRRSLVRFEASVEQEEGHVLIRIGQFGLSRIDRLKISAQRGCKKAKHRLVACIEAKSERILATLLENIN